MENSLRIFVAILLSVAMSCAGSEELALPTTMAAFGDSITAGYNADLYSPGYQPQYSWATGDSSQVNSHYQRLQSLGSGTYVAANLAIPGQKMEGLYSQVVGIPGNPYYPGLQSIPVPIEYSLVLMGHNDVCANSLEEMTPLDEFETQYLTALEAMHSYNPEMRVNVVGIIDVTQLYEIAYDTVTPHQLPDGTYLKCQDVWAAYNICPNALLNGDESRDAVQEQVKQYNKILKKGAHKYGYTYTKDLYKGEMEIEEVSMLDCFHPNIAGQNKIAELSWKQSIFSVDED